MQDFTFETWYMFQSERFPKQFVDAASLGYFYLKHRCLVDHSPQYHRALNQTLRS